MLETLAIRTQRTANSRIAERDAAPLEFGKVFSDHMLVVDYCDGEWQDAQIMPFGDMPVSPANSALHYGQAIFEGMKAYPSAGGGVVLFRPLDNWARLNASAERMCMPPIPEELFMQGIKELVRLDAPWVPTVPGGSLYIRPFMFATDGMLGVRPSDTYRFAIITCPPSATRFRNSPPALTKTRCKGFVGGASSRTVSMSRSMASPQTRFNS